MSSVIKELLRFGKYLSKLDYLAKIGQYASRTWKVAERFFKETADGLKQIFKRSINFVVETVDGIGRLKIVDALGRPIAASTEYLKYLFRTGNLAAFAKVINAQLDVSKKVLADFAKLAKNSPVGAFTNKLKNVARMSEELEKVGKFSRKVTSEAEFLSKVKTAKQGRKLEYLKKLMKGGKKFGNLILISGAGVTAYVLLKQYADKASGCWRTTKVGGSLVRCKAVEYSISRSADSPCNTVHKPKANVEDPFEVMGACYAVCDDDKLDIDESTTHYECIKLDIWDALGDIVGSAADGIVRAGSRSLDQSELLKWGLVAGGVVVVSLVGYKMFQNASAARRNRYNPY